MAGPNKQFDQDEALTKAMHAFWKRGYEATSMQDLVSIMEINRASMYQTYGNKQTLFLASIDCYIKKILEQITQSLDLPGSPLENLKSLFKHVIGQSLQSKMHGCFIANTAIELGPHDPQIAEKLRAVWHQFETTFMTLIQRAIDNQELPPDASAAQLALLLNINFQGLIIKTKVDTPKEELFSSIETLFELIQK
ncbi:Transcriptional regulator, AcrR family [hydrothermal vent metagenome]|uniref:Transcriptional regulator, AcrR family n=1 Tax=hydrothermal vent metagenome TaxID=652676 RepID=A0A3B0ZWB3_9ZZZZ